jgi:hypothetical protein
LATCLFSQARLILLWQSIARENHSRPQIGDSLPKMGRLCGQGGLICVVFEQLAAQNGDILN